MAFLFVTKAKQTGRESAADENKSKMVHTKISMSIKPFACCAMSVVVI